jgi:hypothetical protein
MDVSQILTLLATLSIGLDEPRDSDIVVFMQYINLCYFEILQDTIAQNPLVTINHEFLDCIGGDLVPTTEPIYIPLVIYDIAANLPLTGTTRDKIESIDPALTKTGAPFEWYYSSGIIKTYPISTSSVVDGNGIGVKYIPQPAPLTSESLSAEILIPALFQQVLADGASYYLFQSETGFKDQTKMQASMMRWKEGKQRIFAYMKNISGKKYYSTYSPV